MGDIAGTPSLVLCKIIVLSNSLSYNSHFGFIIKLSFSSVCFIVSKSDLNLNKDG